MKDITASFMQIMVKVLGYKDETSLKYVNLNSEDT
jgi:hypothetical protein